MRIGDMKRYCKSCSIEVGKSKQLCPTCYKKNRDFNGKHWNKTRPLRTGFTKDEENTFLRECVSNGIDTTGKIIKEYIKLGRKHRSQPWLINRLKELGIYKIPDMDSIIWERDTNERENRVNIAKLNGFSIVDNDNRRTAKVKCDKCGMVVSYTTMSKNGCFKCKVAQNQKITAGRRDKKKSAKIELYKGRVNKLKEFVNNEEEYKKYTCYKETPIYKEYMWYNGRMGVKYRETELSYKLQWIGYYVYIVSTTLCPDIPTKEGYKICRKCRVEKNESDFIQNGCKECAKERRKEFYLPKQREKDRERYKKDVVYRLQSIISAYIYGFLKGNPRSQRAGSILGVSVEEFKVYLESNFEDWMNWDNQGKKLGEWQIQHIVPKQFAQTEEEAYLLNHYRNLIPMCAYENNSLHHRVLKEQLNDWHKGDKIIQKILKRNKDRIVDKSIFVPMKMGKPTQNPQLHTQHNFW